MTIIGSPRRKVPEGFALGCEDFKEMVGNVRISGLHELPRDGSGELSVAGLDATAKKWLDQDYADVTHHEPHPRIGPKSFILHDQKNDLWYRLHQAFPPDKGRLIVNGHEETHEPEWWQDPT